MDKHSLTPIKHIAKGSQPGQSGDGQSGDKLSARLQQNIRIIEMINSSRFQRSKSQRKQLLEEVEHNTSSEEKKHLFHEIIDKLSSALGESRVSSLRESKRSHSEAKHIHDKIRLFEDMLEQVKTDNQQTNQRISIIKQQAQIQAQHSFRDYQHPKYRLHEGGYHPGQGRRRIRVEYECKGKYMYPKYIKPGRKPARVGGCVDPDCRGYCRCPM